MKRRPILRIACVQMNAGPDVAKNLAHSIRALEGLSRSIRWAAFPEVFHFRGDKRLLPLAAQNLHGPLVRVFQNLARRDRRGILLGSLMERSRFPGKYYNTSVLIAPTGEVVGVYRKIHLFDVHLRGKFKVEESETVLPGQKVVVSRSSGVRWGLTICYDLRFPELFRRLVEKGAEAIFVPSNFTAETGKAHWEVLLRSRAIENQVFIVAPAQVGGHSATGVESFGTSLIVDPWGRILARGDRRREEIVQAELNFRELDKVRRELPVLQHRRC